MADRLAGGVGGLRGRLRRGRGRQQEPAEGEVAGLKAGINYVTGDLR